MLRLPYLDTINVTKTISAAAMECVVLVSSQFLLGWGWEIARWALIPLHACDWFGVPSVLFVTAPGLARQLAASLTDDLQLARLTRLLQWLGRLRRCCSGLS